MKKIKERINELSGRWLVLISALITGCVVGAGLFSFFVATPKGLENWLSAVGTLLAVVVSLYLANKPKKAAKLDFYRTDVILYKSFTVVDGKHINTILGMQCILGLKNVGGKALNINEISLKISSDDSFSNIGLYGKLPDYIINDPTKLVDQTDKYILNPDQMKPYSYQIDKPDTDEFLFKSENPINNKSIKLVFCIKYDNGITMHKDVPEELIKIKIYKNEDEENLNHAIEVMNASF
ncbi:hypothetical protein [Pediococcus pentosaceus]|uniref:hypothetical protein n=1 Tax=Pediococcus pentosaceus TaxID=1255 RepID=UPI003981C8F8